MEVYASYVKPEKYPAFEKRPVKCVTHEAMNNEIQFISARFFTVDTDNNNFVNIENTIDRYTSNNIGKCFWLNWKTLTVDNIKELIDKIAQHGYWLFGFWGFVPGEQANALLNPWGEFTVSDELNKYLLAKLGDHFLGYEAGEQDGRFIASYASRSVSAPTNNARRKQYEKFYMFLHRIEKNFFNHVTVLGSLPYHHYCARNNSISFLGCASAQALPNSQMWFAFVRGASKQYGLLIFGDVSVWNRWGYKTYRSDKSSLDNDKEIGMAYGTSLSLMKRLIYTQYMYNCILLGIEQSWFYDDDIENYIENTTKKFEQKNIKLTPVGQLQSSVNTFVKKNGSPGVMYTPVAILADYCSGWLPPRTLFSGKIYQIWGNLPYEDGDYQLHLIFSMLYPGYENSGFFHDETGFLTSTPYGEITDVLLSDAPYEILRQYNVIILTNGITPEYETYSKIKKYVSDGGHIVLFGDTVSHFSDLRKFDNDFYDFFGLEDAFKEAVNMPRLKTEYNNNLYEDKNIEIFTGNFTGEITASTDNGYPVIVEKSFGAGKVSLITAKNGMEVFSCQPCLLNNPNEFIFSPCAYAEVVKAFLKDIFLQQRILFPDNKALQYIVNISDSSNLTLLVNNNTFLKQRFDLKSTIPLESVNEKDTNCNLKENTGYYPVKASVNNNIFDGSGEIELEAGDTKLFAVKLSQPIFLKSPSYPQKPCARYYTRIPCCYKTAFDFVLQTPMLQQHFEGIIVDAALIETYNIEFIKKEADLLKTAGLKIIVDLTSLMNHFPDLSFIDSFPVRKKESYNRIDRIIEKSLAYDCFSFLLSFIQNPEGNSDAQMLKSSMSDLISHMSMKIKNSYSRIIVQNSPFVVSAEELYTFLSQSHYSECGYNCSAAISSNISFPAVASNFNIPFLLLCAPYKDNLGQYYHAQLPVCESPFKSEIANIINEYKSVGGDTVLLNADYEDYSQIYADYEISENIYKTEKNERRR